MQLENNKKMMTIVIKRDILIELNLYIETYVRWLEEAAINHPQTWSSLFWNENLKQTWRDPKRSSFQWDFTLYITYIILYYRQNKSENQTF